MIKKTGIVFLILLALVSCNKSESEIVIINENYIGRVIVIFNQEDGEPVNYYDNKRVYVIPENGILKTQFSDNNGIGDFPLFYYKRISEKTLINYKPYNEIPEDTVVGYGPSVGNFLKKYEKGEERLKFAIYYIGNKNQIEKARSQIIKLDTVK